VSLHIVRSPHWRDPKRPRPIPVWGVAIHTTGGGLPAKADEIGRDVLDLAASIYGSMNAYAHYVVAGDGRVLQVCDERQVAPHIGRIVDGVDRRKQYLGGAWRTLLPPGVVELWRKAWPSYPTPYHLFPGPSPNEAYVGVEMLPIHPAPKGIRFTGAQYIAVAHLCAEIAARQNLPAGWQETSRLVGHEDVGLLDRSDGVGGWDPGALRPVDRLMFDMRHLRNLIRDAAPPARVA
jgi:hypothetical protein